MRATQKASAVSSRVRRRAQLGCGRFCALIRVAGRANRIALRFETRGVLSAPSMSYQPTWKERLEDARIYLGPLVAGTIVLGVSGWVVWHQFIREKRAAVVVSTSVADSAASASAAEAATDVDFAARVAARAHDGEAAAAAGRFEEAERVFAEAMALQRELSERHPQSRLAGAARLDELNAQREAALVAPHVAQLSEMAAEITRLLRGGRAAEAVAKIAAASALMDRTLQAYPRAHLGDANLQAQLNFLQVKRGDLALVQEQVRAHLVSLGAGGALFDTEVPQELYRRVMNANPSRGVGPTLPVDSVTWAEAMEFCQRLSWMLGQRVRLPTEAEFRAALGNGVSALWSADSSDGRSHEVGKSAANAAGFFDLLGNLAEWLQPPPNLADRAPLAGGSYIDPVDALRRVPVITADRRERQRYIGFRFVVE